MLGSLCFLIVYVCNELCLPPLAVAVDLDGQSKVLASIVQMQQETLSLLQSLKAQSEQVGSKQHVQ